MWDTSLHALCFHARLLSQSKGMQLYEVRIGHLIYKTVSKLQKFNNTKYNSVTFSSRLEPIFHTVINLEVTLLILWQVWLLDTLWLDILNVLGITWSTFFSPSFNASVISHRGETGLGYEFPCASSFKVQLSPKNRFLTNRCLDFSGIPEKWSHLLQLQVATCQKKTGGTEDIFGHFLTSCKGNIGLKSRTAQQHPITLGWPIEIPPPSHPLTTKLSLPGDLDSPFSYSRHLLSLVPYTGL